MFLVCVSITRQALNTRLTSAAAGDGVIGLDEFVEFYMRRCGDGSSGVGMLEEEDTVIVTLEAQDPAGMEAAVRAATA